jgi:hypothetical protein
MPVHVLSIATGDALGNSAGHGQQASHWAPAKASVAAELTQPGVTLWHSNSEQPADSASASALGPAEPLETGNAPGNSADHGNAQHAPQSAAAKASVADEPTEPGVTPGHGHSPPPHSALAAANGEPLETGNAPGNSADHGNAQHASQSADAKASVADDPAEFASRTGGSRNETAFHFKNQGDPPSSIEAVEIEQLIDRPVLSGLAAGLAAIPQVGPAAMEEHAASHVNKGQHHASEHLPHELLI